jgi:hypothetical protein
MAATVDNASFIRPLATATAHIGPFRTCPAAGAGGKMRIAIGWEQIHVSLVETL